MPMPADMPPMGKRVDGYSPITVSKRIATGIPRLDILLLGGLKPNSITLLVGPPGDEKKLAALQFAAAGLDDGQQVVYVATDSAPAELESLASRFSLPLSENTNKLLKFIDCYSWTLGQPPQGRSDVQVQGPSALNDLAIALSQAIPEQPAPAQPASPGSGYAPSASGADAPDASAEQGAQPSRQREAPKSRVIIHSLSTLLLYNSPDVIFKFMQVTGSRLKSSGATLLLLLETGMHDEKTVSTLRHLADEIIEFEFKGGKGRVRVPLSGVPEWLDFSAGANGVDLV